MMNWVFITLGVLAAAVVVVLLAVSFIERRQAYALAGLEAESPLVASPRTAVVYFSRSGNTALAARHLANRLGARLFALDAPAYRLGPGGLVQALGDANALKRAPEALPDIVPRTLDLTPFDTGGSAPRSGSIARRRLSGPSSSTTVSMARRWCCSTPTTAISARSTSRRSRPG